PNPSGFALRSAAIFRQSRREGPAVQGNAEATAAVATEHGLSFWLASSQIMHAWAVAEHGGRAGGIAQLRQALTAYGKTGGQTYRTYLLSLLAEALGNDGQIEEGLGVLADALSLMQRTGEAFHGAELYRLRGEFLLRHEAAEAEVACHEAETCFRQALTIARQQQAKSLELRAAMSMTRLYQKQGRQVEARPILA